MENKINRTVNRYYRLVFAGSILLIFILPLRNSLVFFQGRLTIGALIGMVVGLSWIGLILYDVQIRRPRPVHLAGVALMCWSILSIIWSIDQNRSLSSIISGLLIIGLIFMIWDLYRTEKAVKFGLQAYAFASFILASSVVINFISGDSYSSVRYSGLELNPNVLATMVLFAIPIAWYLSSDHGRVLPYPFYSINLIYIPLGILSIILTGSRQAMVGLIVALIYIFSSSLEKYSEDLVRSFGIILFIGLIPLIGWLVTGLGIDRLLSIPEAILSGEGSMGARYTQWQAGFQLFISNPILGIGSGAFNTAVEPLIGRTVAPDNTYLQILFELGLIGFLLLIGVGKSILSELTCLDNSEIRLWLSMFLIWVLISMVNDLALEALTWLLLSLLVSQAHAVEIARN
jgi:O-antigen ligase